MPDAPEKGRTGKGWLRSRARGATALEYAVALPALLLLVLGLIDTARLIWTYTTLQRAATAAARWGAINTTYARECATAPCPSVPSAGDIQQKAVNETWMLSVQTSAFSVTQPSCGLQVNVNYSYTFLIPWIGSSAQLRPWACHPT